MKFHNIYEREAQKKKKKNKLKTLFHCGYANLVTCVISDITETAGQPPKTELGVSLKNAEKEGINTKGT